MDELPADLRAFLLNHPFLQLTDGKRIRCSLNGHDFPCSLTELQKFTRGKNYGKLSSVAEFNYKQYEPHIVPSSKQTNQLFCKLTLRHLNRQPHHVLAHVNGKRYQKALSKYEECKEQGVEYVPARLGQKRFKHREEEAIRGRPQKNSSLSWEPSSSDDNQSDSEDSLSDLYPPTLFLLKNQEESMEADGDKKEGEDGHDDFQTDEEEDMEVDKEAQQKRKKVQGGQAQKKFRNDHWRSGRKKKCHKEVKK